MKRLMEASYSRLAGLVQQGPNQGNAPSKGFPGELSRGRCPACASEEEHSFYTSQSLQVKLTERPICPRGSIYLFAASSNCIELWPGKLGFLDDGLVVGKCAWCGELDASVSAD